MITAPADAQARGIEVELLRGAATIRLIWPLGASSDLANWLCKCCEKIIQAVASHVIDKGLPTASLQAQVLVAKYLDHLPLYRQESIFQRAGHLISRSTLAQWVGECGVQLQPLADALAAELLRQPVLHADETPVAMLKPGHGKTHRAYLWSYCTTSFNPIKAVVFDFANRRGGQHVQDFLRLPGIQDKPGWQGGLLTDDFSGYKACFELGVTEVGCIAHARRKFHEVWANHGCSIGEQPLKFFVQLYEVEREVAEADSDARYEARRRRSRTVACALHHWMRQQRQKIPDRSATAKAIDYSLKRWHAGVDGSVLGVLEGLDLGLGILVGSNEFDILVLDEGFVPAVNGCFLASHLATLLAFREKQ